MKVKVLAEKWGRYSQGDELDLEESTAKAIAKHGLIELLDGEVEETAPKKKGKTQK